MQANINYQKELDKVICRITEEKRPTLLLHSCCAPCSSYCMEYLREYFDITVFYYNPNISAEPEYRKRVEEEKRLIGEYNRQVEEYERQAGEYNRQAEEDRSGGSRDRGMTLSDHGMTITSNTHRINIIEGDYDPREFYDIAKGYEKCPEGGERCFRCYELRLRKSFELAGRLGMDYVTSTLTISPLKNAAKINEIGYRLEKELCKPNKTEPTNLYNSEEGKKIELCKPQWLPSDFKKRNGYKRSIELSHEFDLYRQNFCGCAYSKPVEE